MVWSLGLVPEQQEAGTRLVISALRAALQENPAAPVLLTEPGLSHSALGELGQSPGNPFLMKEEEKPGFEVTKGSCEHSLGCVHLSTYFPPLISPVSHGECWKCSFPSGVTTAPTEPAPSSCLSHCSQVWGQGGTKGALGSWG